MIEHVRKAHDIHWFWGMRKRGLFVDAEEVEDIKRNFPYWRQEPSFLKYARDLKLGYIRPDRGRPRDKLLLRLRKISAVREYFILVAVLTHIRRRGGYEDYLALHHEKEWIAPAVLAAKLVVREWELNISYNSLQNLASKVVRCFGTTFSPNLDEHYGLKAPEKLNGVLIFEPESRWIPLSHGQIRSISANLIDTAAPVIWENYPDMSTIEASSTSQ